MCGKWDDWLATATRQCCAFADNHRKTCQSPNAYRFATLNGDVRHAILAWSSICWGNASDSIPHNPMQLANRVWLGNIDDGVIVRAKVQVVRWVLHIEKNRMFADRFDRNLLGVLVLESSKLWQNLDTQGLRLTAPMNIVTTVPEPR